jgi:hypothetical protein
MFVYTMTLAEARYAIINMHEATSQAAIPEDATTCTGCDGTYNDVHRSHVLLRFYNVRVRSYSHTKYA